MPRADLATVSTEDLVAELAARAGVPGAGAAGQRCVRNPAWMIARLNTVSGRLFTGPQIRANLVT